MRQPVEEKLSESEDKFRHLIWDMQVGVLLQGSQSEIIMCNPKSLELLGITEDQALGKTSFDPDWNVIRDDGTPFPGLNHPVPQAIATRKPVMDVIMGVYRPSVRDRVWLLVHAVPQINDDGTVRQVVCTFIDVTRRREAEEAQKENERLLRESQTLAHIGSYEVNLIDRTWKASPEMYSIFGIGPGFPNTVDQWVEIIHPACREQVVASFTQRKKDEMRIDHEYKIIRVNDGQERWIHWLGVFDYDHEMNPVRVVGTMQDITERRQVEDEVKKLNEELEDRVKERTSELLISYDALRQSKEKYRTVADFTYDWEFWLDQNDVMRYCSPSCERITGYNASAFINNPRLLSEIVHPDDQGAYRYHKHNEELAKDANQEIQFRIIRLNGTIRWIGHVCQPIYNDAGDFIGIRGGNRDITGRKEMEHLLTTSEQKYKLLSENITDGIFICRDGSFEYVNKAMLRIFGYEENELDGKKLSQLAAPDFIKDLDNNVRLNTSVNQGWNMELECLQKSLKPVFVEIQFNFVAKEGLVYGVVHDVTEKKQIQQNIVKAIIQTEEKERAYFSKELHDGLGPLLSLIKHYMQWTQRPKSNKSRDDIIQKAEIVIDEALATVKEISNKLSPHILTSYGLTSAIQSFVDKLEETTEISIEFESNVARRPDLEVEAALYRAVIECINNTIKHARAKNIMIRLNDSGAQLQLQYIDDGIGFDLTDTLALQKGLGLFNLQNRIQTIGGKISMVSAPGHGVDYQIIVNLKK